MAVGTAQWTCGYCERLVANDKGFLSPSSPNPPRKGRIARSCPNCRGLSLFADDGTTLPAPLPGHDVDKLPDNVGQIYGEARAALAAGAPTGAALLFRTVLMHVACSLGAQPGETFVQYVNFLEANHHVPPSGKAWLDHIRKQGNLPAHELVTVSADGAAELLSFVHMLLQLVFDFPARVPKAAP
jgi:hypothetical protein